MGYTAIDLPVSVSSGAPAVGLEQPGSESAVTGWLPRLLTFGVAIWSLGSAALLLTIVVGLLVVLIGTAFGFNSGYAINPARDFGPRLFTFLAGWGSGVFTAANHWWWVPVVAPPVGAILGAVLYDACVGKHHPVEAAR